VRRDRFAQRGVCSVKTHQALTCQEGPLSYIASATATHFLIEGRATENVAIQRVRGSRSRNAQPTSIDDTSVHILPQGACGEAHDMNASAATCVL
jgi:hypothetical protein